VRVSYNLGLLTAPVTPHSPRDGKIFAYFRRLWERTALYLIAVSRSPRVAKVTLCALVLLYVVLTALASARRLWHDELFTLYISTAPSWQRFWYDTQLDLNPPLEYLAVRISTGLFGQSVYVVRLPSILAFLAGSLCLYRLVARRLSSWYALLALLVFWASPFFYYAAEARPYGLVIGFLGTMLLLWQRAIEPGRRAVWLWLLAFSSAAMMLSHLMAILYLTPFCLAEAVRDYRCRKVDFGMWAALLVPCPIPFIYVQLLTRFETTIFPPAFQASLLKIVESYFGSLRLEAIPLLVAIGLAWIVFQRKDGISPSIKFHISPEDVALIFGLLAAPAIVNLALMRNQGAYFDRYAFPVAIGYALVMVFFVARRTNADSVAAIAAGSVLLLFFGAFNLGPGLKESVWSRHGVPTTENMGAKLAQVRPDLPLIAASGLTFLEMDHYEDVQTVARLYYLTDRDLAIRYANATIFEGMPDLKAAFPIRGHVADYSSFVVEHPAFLVLGTLEYPEDWLLRALVARHEEVEYLGEFPGPYKDRQLYQVRIRRK
jgi:Dolichyl-phosphate-mannose-protein mannosyltransferase